MKKVPAAAPVALWLGGKKALSAHIIEGIEAVEHRAYIEPFIGMGGVFLRRTWKPVLEVANDFNGEITNLFRILQQHYPQLMDVMRFQIASRREFERLRAVDPSTLTDLQRAARFLYLQRQAFGGMRGHLAFMLSCRVLSVFRLQFCIGRLCLTPLEGTPSFWRLKQASGAVGSF
ncbi:DNA adenine methylase [Tropicibacter sp. R16_0]|nr:DNA adenine methylase [Tropicibacter sp. R16_0]